MKMKINLPIEVDITEELIDRVAQNIIDRGDYVEVVRCKDCANWRHGDCFRIELTGPDDFCSYGERRGENGEEATDMP